MYTYRVDLLGPFTPAEALSRERSVLGPRTNRVLDALKIEYGPRGGPSTGGRGRKRKVSDPHGGKGNISKSEQASAGEGSENSVVKGTPQGGSAGQGESSPAAAMPSPHVSPSPPAAAGSPPGAKPQSIEDGEIPNPLHFLANTASLSGGSPSVCDMVMPKIDFLLRRQPEKTAEVSAKAGEDAETQADVDVVGNDSPRHDDVALMTAAGEAAKSREKDDNLRVQDILVNKAQMSMFNELSESFYLPGVESLLTKGGYSENCDALVAAGFKTILLGRSLKSQFLNQSIAMSKEIKALKEEGSSRAAMEKELSDLREKAASMDSLKASFDEQVLKNRELEAKVLDLEKKAECLEEDKEKLNSALRCKNDIVKGLKDNERLFDEFVKREATKINSDISTAVRLAGGYVPERDFEKADDLHSLKWARGCAKSLPGMIPEFGNLIGLLGAKGVIHSLEKAGCNHFGALSDPNFSFPSFDPRFGSSDEALQALTVYAEKYWDVQKHCMMSFVAEGSKKGYKGKQGEWVNPFPEEFLGAGAGSTIPFLTPASADAAGGSGTAAAAGDAPAAGAGGAPAVESSPKDDEGRGEV
ncbi:hypothetical protein PVAP13_4KG232420 [Panicum virgatum]|uniref:Uncharacterized protein n=3 Tax=Panicum virgatum TaxID=38727 RepID=A0A8T0TSS9_PANVG|nr:hypothetical protein PVAP13_4KG232420 [Panicum virgatum]